MFIFNYFYHNVVSILGNRNCHCLVQDKLQCRLPIRCWRVHRFCSYWVSDKFPMVAYFQSWQCTFLKTVLCKLLLKKVVVLPFEEMCTPHVCGREICIQKLYNYIEKAPLPPSNDSVKYWDVVPKRCTLSFHNTRVPSVIVCRMCSLRRVETESHFLHTLYASLPWFCVQLAFDVYYMQKFAVTWPLV